MQKNITHESFKCVYKNTQEKKITGKDSRIKEAPKNMKA